MTYHRILLHLLLVFSINIGLLGQNKPPVKQCRITKIWDGTEAQYQAAVAWRDSGGLQKLHQGGNRPIQWKQLHSFTIPSNGYGQPYRSGSYSRPVISTPPIIIPRPRVTCRVSRSANKFRIFTDTKGGEIEGRLLSISSINKTAKIRRKDGLCFNISVHKFCNSDLNYLKAWWNKRNSPKQLTGYKAFLARRKNG